MFVCGAIRYRAKFNRKRILLIEVILLLNLGSQSEVLLPWECYVYVPFQSTKPRLFMHTDCCSQPF